MPSTGCPNKDCEPDVKLEIKNILDSYFSDKDPDNLCPACTPQQDGKMPLRDIAAFIKDNGLLLRPENLELAWEYSCGNNARLQADIDALIADEKFNNSAAEEIHAKYLKQDLAKEIDRIVVAALEQIDAATNIMDGGAQKAINCEEKLLKQADSIRSRSGNVDSAIKRLLDLSQLMVESTRENREQIAQTNQKLAELQAELESAREDADFDQLTKLPNRRKFERTLDEAFEHFSNGKNVKPPILAFVDIDHFKKINDNFGHDCGDRVLRVVADALSSLSSKQCHASRYGGEEFALVFEGKDIDEVFRKVDQCRDDLAARDLVDLESGKALGQVSFSAGVAQFVEGDNPRSVLRKADLALYEAKSKGRNMVLKYSNGG